MASEDRVNEGRHGGTLRQHAQATENHHRQDNRKEPKFLSHAKELGSRQCYSLWGMYNYWFCPQPEWPLVSDLNADGKPELLVPDGSTRLVGGNELKKEKWYNGKPAGGLSVFIRACHIP